MSKIKPATVILLPVLCVFSYGSIAEDYSASNDVNRNRFIEEVVVTAQKREQNQFDVPLAITAHSGEYLKDLGVTSFSYFSSFVPGIVIQEQSVNNSGFMIRGITNDELRATQTSRVSVFQDGVDISRLQGANVAFFDIDRIEVLQGPQGTLFGRGAQIGAISLHSNRAEHDRSAEVRYQVGDYNEQVIEGYYNSSIIEDTLSARLAFYFNQRDGYIDNLAGGTLNGVDTRALRLSFAYTPRDQTSIDVIFNHESNKPPGIAFESFFFEPDDPYEEVFLNGGSSRLRIDREIMSMNVNVQHTVSDEWSLESTTAYREFDSFENFDADGTALQILEIQDDAEHRQWSQELRFNFDNGEKLTGFIGGNIFWKRGFEASPLIMNEQYIIDFPKLQAELSSTSSMPPVTADTPVVAPALYNADGSPNPITTLNQSNSSLALFGNFPLNPEVMESQKNIGETQAIDIFVDGSYQMSDRLSLTSGIRFTYEEIESWRETPIFASQAGIAPLLDVVEPTWNGNFLITPAGSEVNANGYYTGVVGRLVLHYLLREDLNSYLSCSRGRRPDAIDFSNRSEIYYLDEEIVDSIEYGLKYANVKLGLVADMAVFYYDYDNFLTEVSEADGLGFIVDDSGEATSSGIQLAATWLATDGLSLFFNTAYLDSRIEDDEKFFLADHRFRLTPEWSGATGFSFRDDVAGIGVGYLTLTYAFQTDVYFEDNNDSDNGVNRQGSYGLANLRTGLVSQSDGWEVNVFVSNIFDKEYIIDAGNAGSVFGISTFIPGAPRMFGAGFVLRI